MANTLQNTVDLYAKYFAREVATAPLIRAIRPKHDKKWDGKTKGNTVNFKVPPKYTTGSSLDVSSAIQDIDYTTKPLELDILSNTAVQLSGKELKLEFLENEDYRSDVLKPITDAIIEDVETQINEKVAKEAKHNFNISTPGSQPTSLSDFTDARARLVEYGCRSKEKKMTLNPTTMGQFVNNNSSIFNPQARIGKQYETGEVQKAAGFDWIENECTYQHTVGAHGGTPVVNGASQSGTSLVTDGWTASTTVLKAGDVFTVANVKEVATKTGSVNVALTTSYPYTVAADVTSDASGNATITLTESVSATAGKLQNVDALPEDNATITVVGTASQSYRQNLVFVPRAIGMASVGMQIPKNAEFASKGTYEGVTITFIRDFDIKTHQFITRVDFLGGVKVVYPEWTGRVWSP